VRGAQLDADNLDAMKKVVETMKSHVRIILLMTYGIDLRNILITALDLGMMNGEYVFIANEEMLAVVNTPQTYRPEADEVIYEALMAVGEREPSGQQYDTFRQQVIDELQHPQFDHLPHLPPDASMHEVHMKAGTADLFEPSEIL
jgi:hypothetical protein